MGSINALDFFGFEKLGRNNPLVGQCIFPILNNIADPVLWEVWVGSELGVVHCSLDCVNLCSIDSVGFKFLYKALPRVKAHMGGVEQTAVVVAKLAQNKL